MKKYKEASAEKIDVCKVLLSKRRNCSALKAISIDLAAIDRKKPFLAVKAA